jgi:hypothetical protein
LPFIGIGTNSIIQSVAITGGDCQTPTDCRLEVIRHLPMSETSGEWQSRPEFADQIAAL